MNYVTAFFFIDFRLLSFSIFQIFTKWILKAQLGRLSTFFSSIYFQWSIIVEELLDYNIKSLKNNKSYLQDGPKTKDTDGCLVT